MRIAVIALAAALAGCAAQPQQTVVQLDSTANKYSSEECRAARQTALAYDDNTGTRIGAGLALGLFLGPFGIPLAIAMDASQNTKREAINSELMKHCGGIPATATIKAPSPVGAMNSGGAACMYGAGPC